jgi:hypothetical protein
MIIPKRWSLVLHYEANRCLGHNCYLERIHEETCILTNFINLRQGSRGNELVKHPVQNIRKLK